MFFFYVAATDDEHHRSATTACSPISPSRPNGRCRLFTLIFGACAFENSCLDWASDHRRHHKHVDHDEDPYDISKGFLWAHIGWLMFKLNPEPPMDNVNDLRKDKLVMWQHKYCPLDRPCRRISSCRARSLGSSLNGWSDAALGGFLIAGVARIVVAQHCTFFINSLCHTIGRQPYSSSHSARDSAIMAFLTFGEGYHNYHHEFQHDYRNGVKPGSGTPPSGRSGPSPNSASPATSAASHPRRFSWRK